MTFPAHNIHAPQASPGPDRWKQRSRFFPGLAAAMAHQWGDHAARAYERRAA